LMICTQVVVTFSTSQGRPRKKHLLCRGSL